MAWRGTGSDPNIYWSQFLNGAWTQQRGLGATTNSVPELAYFKGREYMAWRGLGADDHIWWSTFNGSEWSAQSALVDRRTQGSPGMS